MEFSEFQEAVKKEFENCLKRFSEIKDVRLEVELVQDATEIAGFLGHRETERVIGLIVPVVFLKKNASPSVLRPFIYHELSHIIDKKDPDRIFFERADEPSKKMWKGLEEMKVKRCIVEEESEES